MFAAIHEGIRHNDLTALSALFRERITYSDAPFAYTSPRGPVSLVKSYV